VFLVGGVEDVEETCLAVHRELLAVGVIDRHLPILLEVARDKPHRERRLAHPGSAQHHHPVLRHLVSATRKKWRKTMFNKRNTQQKRTLVGKNNEAL
jgi:hypothetical protein